MCCCGYFVLNCWYSIKCKIKHFIEDEASKLIGQAEQAMDHVFDQDFSPLLLEIAQNEALLNMYHPLADNTETKSFFPGMHLLCSSFYDTSCQPGLGSGLDSTPLSFTSCFAFLAMKSTLPFLLTIFL